MDGRLHAAPSARPARREERRPDGASGTVPPTPGQLEAVQRVIGNRALTALIQRMPYDSLSVGRYYRVRHREEVLFLKEKHRQRGCRFTRHEDDRFVHAVGVPNFDDVEREATAAEITGVRARHLLALHAQTLARADAINRTLSENSARIRSGQLQRHESERLRETNIRLSSEMAALLERVIGALYRTATDYDGLRLLMGMFLRGELPGTPWSSGRLMPESSVISEHLQWMTELGFITYESQPSGQSREIAPGVREHQNAYLEISGPPELMAALQEGIVEANSAGEHQITVVQSGASAVALRTLVGSSEAEVQQVLDAARTETAVTREGDRYVAPIPMRVANDARYRQRLLTTNPALARATQGHVTLVLVSDRYRDQDATVFFDDLIDLMLPAVARVQQEASAAQELTPEEAQVGHLAELL